MEHIKKLRTFLSEKFWMDPRIKAASRKSYKDIKTLSSSVKGGLRLYYPMNRDFYLSSIGVLLFVFLLFFINTFLPPAPSFQTLLKGLFLTEMANASCLKLMIGCAFMQLAWMPLIFYAVRSPMENYIYPGYFVSFKEKTLWKVYIILTLLYILILSHLNIFIIFIILIVLNQYFFPILSFAFKYLIQHIRGPRLNPSTGFNISSNLGEHMKIFVVFMFFLVFLIVLQAYVFNDKDFF